MKRKILYGLLAVVIIAQFLPIFQPKFQQIDPANDFLATENPPAEVASLLKAACYDCHSSQPKYPWYARVAPVSWWIGNHIVEGVRHLNFSDWKTYSDKKRNHKYGELVEMVEGGEMPLKSYLWLHGEAVLTAAQRQAIVDFCKSKYQPEPEEGH